jgi:predicted negative regulator of RcsB-dependent stress response
MSQEVKNKSEGHESALENPEVMVEKLSNFEHYIEQNSKKLTMLIGAIVLVVAGYFGYQWWSGTQNEEAQEQMFSAIYYFESDSLKKALNGDGNHPGLLSIAEDYPFTKSGNLANFYIGSIYLKQGKYQDAVDYLAKFSSADILIQPRAHCLMGDAYLELNDLDKALEYYKKAALHAPNKYFSPRYLLKAGLVQELQKNYSDAINTYGTIIEKYYDSQEMTEAKKLKARLEQMTEGAQ